MKLQAMATVLLLLADGAAGVVAQAPRFPSEANRVTVDAVVTDGEGLPVAGLTRDDFVVKENGVVQPVLEFEAVDVSESRPDSPGDEATAVATNATAEGPGRSFLLVVDDLNLSGSAGSGASATTSRFPDCRACGSPPRSSRMRCSGSPRALLPSPSRSRAAPSLRARASCVRFQWRVRARGARPLPGEW